MAILLALIRKEFSQIFRNTNILRLMLMAPIVQLIVIPLAADFEVKHINLAVVDHDRSPLSQKIQQDMISSGYFRLKLQASGQREAQAALDRGLADMTLEIPVGFERQLYRENEARLYLNADAVNVVKAGLALNYGTQIIRQVNDDIRSEQMRPKAGQTTPGIETTARFWYNPSFNYRRYMAPGILALLLIMVGAMMSSLNIVREREIGTLEQINVTPVRSYQFLLAKLVPFWLIGLVSLTLGLLVCYLVFGIISAGGYLTIYVFTMVFLIAALGIGQLIALFTDTQQQATLFAFFFMMMFVFLSGLYTPVESMPDWARTLAWANSVTHFVDVMRSVTLKGSSIGDLQHRLWALILFAVLFNALAVLKYQKRGA